MASERPGKKAKPAADTATNEGPERDLKTPCPGRYTARAGKLKAGWSLGVLR